MPSIKNGESYTAVPDRIQIVGDPNKLYPFATDHREQYAHTWLLITLTEGKYRQVRKMVLAARHRCQRLIRLSISNLELGNLKPGQVKEMDATDFYGLLGIPQR